MSFQTQSATKMYVKLVADYVTFLGRRQLVEYVVGDVTMVDVNDNSSYSSLKVRQLKFTFGIFVILIQLYVKRSFES